MTRPVMLLVLLLLTTSVGGCVSPRTVEVPSASPFSAPPTRPATPGPSIYSLVPDTSPNSQTEQAAAQATEGRSPQPPGTPARDLEPRPDADVAGIRCGDEETEEVKGTTVVTRTTCYSIEGTTMGELDLQMRSRGPRAEGKHAIAVTRWLVRWSYDARTTAEGCELVTPDVQTVAVYRYPTWEPTTSTVEGTRSEYRAFMRKVQEHEQHHRALAVAAGVAIRRSLLDLPPTPDCSVLEGKAKDAFHEVFRRYELKQEAFDAAAGGIGY